jgi:hypothetical protein
VNNADGDRQFDADTEQREEGVLRAKDIIPALRTTHGPEAVPHEPGQNTPPPPAEAETSVETEQRRSEIPRFDLAEKIMAEQRKITAIRRKGPGQTDEAQNQLQEVGSVSDTKEQMSADLSEQEQIIAEIVARDVERLCRGETLRLRNG